MNKSVHIQILHFEQILDKNKQTKKQKRTEFLLVYLIMFSHLHRWCGMASEDLCE